MIKIPIGDWFLARSEAFNLLVERFKEHRAITKTSFSRIKTRHYNYDRKINEMQARIKEMESVIDVLQEIPNLKVRKKKKTN